MKKLAAVLFLASIVSGCADLSVGTYAINADSVATLRTYNNNKINVGEFTDPKGTKRIHCRAVGPISTTSDQTYAEYIRKAFVSELKMAESYSESSTVTLTGKIDKLTFDSFNGFWLVEVTISSSNGKSIFVTEQHSFNTAFFADVACRTASHEFIPTVQKLTYKIVTHPEFKGLIR